MSIALTNGATLKGQISSTAAIHVTKAGSDAVKAAAAGEKTSDAWTSYQNTSFPIGHYFDIGQVANRIQSNTFNTVDVSVDDGSTWTVTGDGILNNVTLADADSITADYPVTLKLSGTLTVDGQEIDLNAAPAAPTEEQPEVEAADADAAPVDQSEDINAAESRPILKMLPLPNRPTKLLSRSMSPPSRLPLATPSATSPSWSTIPPRLSPIPIRAAVPAVLAALAALAALVAPAAPVVLAAARRLTRSGTRARIS